MENNQEYSNLRCYDEKGRRVAIFARHITLSDGSAGEELVNPRAALEITVITCSKQDNFSKKRANTLYRNHIAGGEGCHPDLFHIEVREDKPKWTFLMWCKENYFKLIPYMFGIQGKVLVRGEEGFNFIYSIDGEVLPLQDDGRSEISEN